jgi:Ca2+/Na+ antiporter
MKIFNKKSGNESKKDTLSLLFIDLAMVGFGGYLFLETKQISLPLSLLLLLALVNYFLLSKRTQERHNLQETLQKEFIEIFAYFSIFLRNHIPVYHALEECRSYASPLMEDRLRRLLSAIDNDKSVRPFIAFADEFSSHEIRQLMLSVFQMVEQGDNEAYLRQFSLLFSNLASNKQSEELKKEEDKLSMVCMLPLLASGLTMVLVTVGVVVAIGGLINGL